MSSGTPRTMSLVLPCWTSVPSRRVRTTASAGSKAPAVPRSGISIQGPRGQAVSKALARTHWVSPGWRSRAETSLATV